MRLMTVYEFAEFVGTHTATIWRKVQKGEIPRTASAGGVVLLDKEKVISKLMPRKGPLRWRRQFGRRAPLVTAHAVAEATSRNERMIRRLAASGDIPFLDLGYRTLRFDLDLTMEELEKKGGSDAKR